MYVISFGNWSFSDFKGVLELNGHELNHGSSSLEADTELYDTTCTVNYHHCYSMIHTTLGPNDNF